MWIQMLCPVRVSCSAGEQQGALLSLIPEISTAQHHRDWTADTACWSSLTLAALHFLECFGKRLWVTDGLPALEEQPGSMNSGSRAEQGWSKQRWISSCMQEATKMLWEWPSAPWQGDNLNTNTTNQWRESHLHKHVHSMRGVTAPSQSWDLVTKGWQPGC